MDIETFNKTYKRKGGIKQLSLMRENLESLNEISKRFGVCKERARQWMTEIFHENYDPRNERKRKKVEILKELIQEHGVEKTKSLYPGINKGYLEEAIKQLIK